MGARNTFGDLNDLLFEQLETLGDRDLSAEDLDREIKRAKAIEGVATKMIDNGRLVLDAQQQIAKAGLMTADELWNPLAPGRADKRRQIAAARNQKGNGGGGKQVP